VSVLTGKLGLKGSFWDAISNLDLNAIGLVIVGLFVATWATATAFWLACN